MRLANQATDITSQETKQYRKALDDWINQHRPNIWVTLRAEGGIDYIDLSSKLDRFINLLLQRAYGSRWHRQPLTIRPQAFGFIEQPLMNKHVNLMLSADEKFHLALLQYGTHTWRQIMPGGQVHVEMKEIGGRARSYATKEQRSLDRISTFYVYSPGHF